MNLLKQNISKRIGDVLYQLSGIEMDSLNITTSFIELGFDSLFLIQFSTKLKKELGVVVTFRQMLSEISSTALLIDYIWTQSTPATSAATDSPNSAEDLSANNAMNDAKAGVDPGELTLDALLVNISEALSHPAMTSVSATGTRKNTVTNAESSVGLNESGTQLESVISKQLDIMAQQLAMLSESTTTDKRIHYSGSSDQTLHTSSGSHCGLIKKDVSALEIHSDKAQSNVQASVTSPQSAVHVSAKTATPKPTIQPFGAIARIQTGLADELTETQRDWLTRFTHRYNVRTENSKTFTERNRDVHADPRVVSGFKPVFKELVYPIVAKRTNGCRIWDQDDNEYIDVLNGFGSNYFGYADPFITQAVVDQLWKGAEIGPQNPLTGEAAKLICEFTGMDRVGFCNTGSEAVMGAMRIARTLTGKDLVVIFSGSYHGIFDEVLVRGTPHLQSIPAAPGITDASVQSVLVLEYGTDESIEIIEERIEEIAAVMVEPVQSRRPDFQPREFLRKLRTITEAQDIPFIFDEVITGFRTAPGGAQEFFDIKADIATYGKVVGGGMQIGVVAGRKRYMDALDGGSWKFGDRSEPEEAVTYFAGTFVRHPASIAACLAALTILKNGGPALQLETNRKTAALAATLNQFFQESGAPLKVAYFGSLWRMEFEHTESFSDILYYLIRENGVHIYDRFPCFLTLRHTENDVRYIIDAIKDSVSELQSVGFIDSKKKVTRNTLTTEGSIASYPLTDIQRSIWLTAQISQEANIAYNEPLLLRLTGRCDLSAIRRAVDFVYQRHDALHARFSSDGNFQRFPAPDALKIPFHDFAANDCVLRRELLDATIERVSRTPFDLINGPLLKIEIIQQSEEETVLIFSAHHIVCDGWSWNALLSEIGNAYSALVRGEKIQFPDAHSFCDFVIEDFEYNHDVKEAGSVGHWVSQLHDTPVYLDLPTDRARTVVGNFSGDTVTHHMSQDLYNVLKALSIKQNTSLFILLSSAFFILISRISQQQKLVMSTPVAGQMLPGQFDLVGCCIRLLPIAADVDEDLPFEGFLDRMKSIVLDGLENINVDFSEVLKNQLKANWINRTPFTEVCFNLDRDEAGVSFEDLTTKVEQTRKMAVINDIFFNVNEGSEGLKIDCDYNTDLFERSTVVRWIASFEVLLEAIGQAPESPISHLSSMTRDERDLLLKNGMAVKYPFSGSNRIDVLFDQQASETPDALAIISGSVEISYRQLYEQSNKLANYLQHMGIRVGDGIGIYLDRSPLALIAMLATMKAEGVCIPLDPTYPAERIRYMVNDSEVEVILTNEQLLNQSIVNNSSFADKLFSLERNWPGVEKQAIEFTGKHCTRQADGKPHVAFILYTSASTGTAVGVKTRHDAHIRRFEWMWRQYPFSGYEMCCQKTSLCFIDSVWELFGPLLKGVPSVFVQIDTIMDSVEFLEIIESHRVSRIVLVPTLLRLLVNSAISRKCYLPSLRYCFSSGEILAPELARDFKNHFPHCKLVNLYGTTEVSGDATFHECLTFDDKQKVYIGTPIDNSCIFLLDRYGKPVPVGSTGEICIGGEILAAEYHNRPDLNDERFIGIGTLSFTTGMAQLPTSRLFKTGDLGRVGSEGSIEFIGRNDTQININGIRVDLAEIQGALQLHDDVAECHVDMRAFPIDKPHDCPSVEKCLVAYVRTHDNKPAEAADIRAHMKKHLPLHMVPQHYFQLVRFPLTPNGKLNRQQLLQQADLELVHAERTRVPRTFAEEILLASWSNGLGISDINMEDNYFDLGSSFSLIKILSSLRQEYDITISIRDCLRYPTLENLAKFIAPQLAIAGQGLDQTGIKQTIFSLQKGGGMLPLLLIPPAGVTETYFMPMLAEMDPSIPIYSISPDEIMKYKSLASYSEHLAQEWMQLCPNSPCIVAGMCMGTHLAFELTNHLCRNGHDVPFLTVIDHDAPVTSVAQTNRLLSQNGPMGPVIRGYNHLKAGRLGRLMLRVSIAIERNFDDDLDHYMKVLEWQNRISGEYEATPCDTDILVIQSEEYAKSRNIAEHWKALTSGDFVVATLNNVMHDDFTEDEPEPLYRVAQVLNQHIRKVCSEKRGNEGRDMVVPEPVLIPPVSAA